MDLESIQLGRYEIEKAGAQNKILSPGTFLWVDQYQKADDIPK